MQGISSTIIFWTVFGLAYVVLLPRYYAVGRSARRATELRITTFVIDILVLMLLTLPWIPVSRGGPITGLSLVTTGDGWMIATVLCICAAVLLFVVSRISFFLKIGVTAHLLATPFIFIAMLRLLPGTFAMTLADTAPVAAVLLLLCGNVAALLLWHRLQMENAVDWTAQSMAITGCFALAIFLTIGFFSTTTSDVLPTTNDVMDAATSSSADAAPLHVEDAVNIVRKLPAVIEYLQRVPGANIEVDHEEDGAYVVHVYEVTGGHTATFNWYTVDQATRKVTTMFE